MRPLFTFLLILGAGLCYMAGYTVGKKHEDAPQRTTSPQASEAKASSPHAPEALEAATALPEISTQPSVPSSPQPLPTAESFARRAQMSVITLTDTKDRSLKGEFLEVTEQHLKVRRQIDRQILEVPVVMLCEEDQAFAAYLFAEKKSLNQSTSKTDADMIWDELFKGM